MKRCGLFFVLTLLSFLSVNSSSAQTTATTCLSYPSNSTPPSGYGTSWNLFSSVRELLVKTNCPTSGTNLNLTVGSGDSTQAVYRNAYSYRPDLSSTNPWRIHTLTGTLLGGDWLSGQGTASITAPASASATNPMYFVGYVCTNQSGTWKCGCSNTTCATPNWQLQSYKGITTGSGGVVGGKVVHREPARTIHLLPNRTGGGVQDRIPLPPADEYFMDLTVRYDERYDWDTRDGTQSGKFPGLAGGEKSGGGNCTTAQPNSWSARNGFQHAGRMTTYLYFQDRDGNCGIKYQWKNPDGSNFHFVRDRTYRVTQYIKVNTPGVANGIDQVWVDGVQVYSKNDIEWRGNVSPSEARVDQLMYHVFFGGENINDTPTYDSYVHFGEIFVMSCRPDFSRPAGTCAN